MHPLLGGLLLLLAVVFAFGVLALLISKMKADQRTRAAGSGSLGHAMQELEGLFVESKRHTLTIQRSEEAEPGATADDV
jgi:hypothetical protein